MTLGNDIALRKTKWATPGLIIGINHIDATFRRVNLPQRMRSARANGLVNVRGGMASPRMYRGLAPGQRELTESLDCAQGLPTEPAL